MKKGMWLTCAGLTLSLLTACSGPGQAPAPDEYANPAGTAPVPFQSSEITASFSASISEKPDTDGLLTLNIPGFVDAKGQVVKDLNKANFTVIEDDKLKGFTASAASASSSIPTDIVFVFDTTGSMAAEITGVAQSIVAFSKSLEASGLNVRLGAVTFGDAFDTVSAPTSIPGGVALGTPSAPPAFDPNERPTLQLTDNFNTFRSFIGANTARGGADNAENALGALEFANASMAWRSGAARVLIVITDIYQHQAGSAIPIDNRWAPKSLPVLLGNLKGKATVHVIGPDLNPSDIASFADMKNMTGTGGTGGVFINLDTGLTGTALTGWSTEKINTKERSVHALDLDLTKLPIQAVVANSYTLKYRGSKTAGTHTVRVRVESGTVKAETTISAKY